MSDENIHNPLQDFHDLLFQLETAVVAPIQYIPLAIVEADNETLLPNGGYLAIVNDCSWLWPQIMDGPVSPAARIFFTTMPDGPYALPAFVWEIVFLTISMIGQAFHWWFVRQVV